MLLNENKKVSTSYRINKPDIDIIDYSDAYFVPKMVN